MKLDKILVPLDGSMLAEEALSVACGFAERDGSLITLLRAAEAMPRPGGDPVEAQVTAIREAEEYLAAVVRRLADKGVRRVETHVWYGPPAAAIVEAAEAQKADLIVMSTDGRNEFLDSLRGSHSERVLRHGVAPLLTVPVGALAATDPREQFEE